MPIPQLEQFLARAEQFMQRVENSLNRPIPAPDWSTAIAFRYRVARRGDGTLVPIRHANIISFDALKEIDHQKESIRRNTAQFVKGHGSNNVLLTGARGTGKSSLIRACLGEFASDGLRIIEMDKMDLIDLPEIMELVRVRPERFIVFCDDLSFDEGDTGYKALKSALDGSIASNTDNVLIYATSNRRHLLPEYVSENETYTHTEDGEVHPGEVVEEKISLSERFGLWISFYSFNQDEYLSVAAQWLKNFGLSEAQIADARQDALRWALARGARSGRIAWQFARDYAGKLGFAG